MPILDTMRAYLSGSEQIVSECRHCGTTVEAGVERCPECDKEAIVRYHVA
ncbi:hypothetical protein HAPAU_03650 [Halalkalicoccus paucihalophilus]|uniref:Small CPxCG-related zinc finger protein n=1 Tax=Halalkalicoccus paucihalophilus TaxID=1008153 RepID=A0A151AJW1_9EURY|nr:hypothetical protein [Halalkalicoccus paucihalophilus]KYH27697.1 hypothetical protein HAPAU_03650 [Halalkalicoccus paucihalophilus]